MKIIFVSIISLLAACSFEGSKYLCESDQQGTKDDQGRLCDNGIWVDNRSANPDTGETDADKIKDVDPATDTGSSDVNPSTDAGDTTDADASGDIPCAVDEQRCGTECVNTSSAFEHCGGCDSPCGSGENCKMGVCANDCDAATPDLCENTCVDTNSNVTYCGDCNTTCPDIVGSTVSCDAGVCGFTCEAGRADCDLLPETGCEVDLKLDVANCGACGTPGVRETCDLIDNDCNGIVDDGPPEICDGVDNNCDGDVDEGCPSGIIVSAPDFGVHQQFGNLNGGDAFEDDCADGQALYRFNGKKGGNIDRLRARCARLVFEVDKMVSPYAYSISRNGDAKLSYHGTINTASFDIECPTDHFVVGVTVEASDAVHEIGMHCAPLIVSETAGVYSISYGAITTVVVEGSNVGTKYEDALTAPSVVGTIRGRAGAFVDAFGIGEKQVTLTFQ